MLMMVVCGDGSDARGAMIKVRLHMLMVERFYIRYSPHNLV